MIFPHPYIDALGRLRDMTILSTAYRDHDPRRQVTLLDLDDLVRNFVDLVGRQAIFRVPLTLGYENEQPTIHNMPKVEAWVCGLRRLVIGPHEDLLVADFEQCSLLARSIVQARYVIGCEIYHRCPDGMPFVPGKVLRRVGMIPHAISSREGSAKLLTKKGDSFHLKLRQ